MLWIIGVPALCLLVCLPQFMHYKHSMRYSLAAMFKSAGTLCALIPALVAAIRLDPRCYICVLGLLLHAAADYLLEFNLLFGGGFFLAGHICYIAFFSILFPLTAVHMICLAILLAVLIYTFIRYRDKIGKKAPLLVIYGVSLSVMCAFAVGSLSAGIFPGIMIAAGGALFFISDYILLHRTIYTAGRAVSWVIMITYYSAQLLFGISCLYI